MVLEFVLTPHTKNIIVGRKVGRDEDDILTCAAKFCLHKQKKEEFTLINDKDNQIANMNPVLIDEEFGKEIIVQGFVKCSRCMNKVFYPDDLGNFDTEKQEASSLICSACSKKIPLKNESGNFVVKWTQRVVSKHRRHKHDYYHGECWDAMFVDVNDDESEAL